MNANPVSNSTEAGDDRLLQHYFRYVIREESGSLRDRMQRGLVERALKTGNPTHTMTVSTIVAGVEEQQRLPTGSYPRELVVQSLNELLARGYVDRAGRSKAGDDLYRLAKARFELLELELGRASKRERASLGSVVDKVDAALGEPLEPVDRERIERAFVDFVGTILATFGEHCALNLVESRHWLSAPEYPRFQQGLEAAVQTLSSELQEPAREAFQETLRAPSAEESEYLFSVGQFYYVVSLLQLDPELQGLQRARFEETCLFHDTNLLIAVLLEEHSRHDAVIALASLCRDLGFHLHYSEKTIEELERLIDAADEEYRRHPPFDLAMAAELADAVDSPFLQAYFLSWPEHKLSWQQYRTRIAAWRDDLRHHGITLSEDCPRRVSGSRYDHLRTLLERRPPDRNGARRPPKRPRAAEHDAQMIRSVELLIEGDAGEAHPFGHRYWLVTLDRSLAETARGNALPDIGAVCMLVEEWVQYISPFLGPDVSDERAADVFARLLGSRFFVSLGAGISLEDLQPFTAPNVKDLFEGLTREEACRAVAKAAQSEAIAAADPSQRHTVALSRLVSLVEEQVARKRKRGELLSKAELRELEETHARERVLLAETAAEKDTRIRALEQELGSTRGELAESRRKNRWSPAYQVPRLWAALLTRLDQVGAWVRRRLLRLLVIAAMIGAAVVLAVEWRGVIGLLLAVLAVVIALVAADWDVVRRNLKRLFG